MLRKRKKSVVLIQGVVKGSLFDLLIKRKCKEIFILEGRPTLEAAMFSCQTLLKRKIFPTLISDNMAGFLFYRNLVKEVWIAYQFDEKDGALCDIGALILGVLGKRHNVPVNLYPAQRKTHFIGRQKDLIYFQEKRIAPLGVKGYAPLLEWLPNKYITRTYL